MKKLMTRRQYDLWIKKIPKDTCTFCHEDQQIILKKFNYWLWVANLAPYWYWHTMLVPKRHFVEFDEMTFLEAAEFTQTLSFIKKKFIDAKLARSDGELVEKFVFFWRFRVNRFDKVSGTVRPNHFHLHIAPDKDHLWDSTLEKDAYKCNILEKLGNESF